jgi:4-hydroxy-tetrahydrodipicolinate reductase
MNVALAGTGQMGQAVADIASARDHRVVATFDASTPLLDARAADLNGAEVVIDFSVPGVALDHIHTYCQWQQPAVVGTTGWYSEIDTVAAWVDEHDATLLYAANFSVGVALLQRAVAGVLPLLDQLPDYDAYLHEMHHARKVDSPSGTAHMLAETVIEGLARKSHVASEAQHQRIDPAALHVSSTRTGDVFGEHTVGFDSAFDRLEFIHRAKNRRGFAFGALRAAEWLPGRRGLFTLDDVLADWLSTSHD